MRWAKWHTELELYSLIFVWENPHTPSLEDETTITFE